MCRRSCSVKRHAKVMNQANLYQQFQRNEFAYNPTLQTLHVTTHDPAITSLVDLLRKLPKGDIAIPSLVSTSRLGATRAPRGSARGKSNGRVHGPNPHLGPRRVDVASLAPCPLRTGASQHLGVGSADGWQVCVEVRQHRVRPPRDPQTPDEEDQQASSGEESVEAF